MGKTDRASYERTHNITCTAAQNIGLRRGCGVDFDPALYSAAVSEICKEAGVTEQTARKHLGRYLLNLPPRVWGRYSTKKKS